MIDPVRRALITLPLAAASLTLPGMAGAIDLACQQRLLACLPRGRGVRRAGDPSVQSAALQQLIKRLGGSTLILNSGRNQLIARIDEAIHDDRKAERLARVNGWLVTDTEAALLLLSGGWTLTDAAR